MKKRKELKGIKIVLIIVLTDNFYSENPQILLNSRFQFPFTQLPANAKTIDDYATQFVKNHYKLDINSNQWTHLLLQDDLKLTPEDSDDRVISFILWHNLFDAENKLAKNNTPYLKVRRLHNLPFSRFTPRNLDIIMRLQHDHTAWDYG